MQSMKRMILVAGIAGLALVYVWQHASVMEIGYELVSLSMKRKELLERNRFLQVELAELKSPDRIERLARERFHMQPPDRIEVVAPREP